MNYFDRNQKKSLTNKEVVNSTRFTYLPIKLNYLTNLFFRVNENANRNLKKTLNLIKLLLFLTFFFYIQTTVKMTYFLINF